MTYSACIIICVLFLMRAVMVTMNKAREVAQIVHTRTVYRKVAEDAMATEAAAQAAVALGLPADATCIVCSEVSPDMVIYNDFYCCRDCVPPPPPPQPPSPVDDEEMEMEEVWVSSEDSEWDGQE